MILKNNYSFIVLSLLTLGIAMAFIMHKAEQVVITDRFTKGLPFTHVYEGTNVKNFPKTLYRGITHDDSRFDKVEETGLMEPWGGTATILQHIMGDTKSNYLSTTESFQKAFGFATDDRTKDGGIGFINSGTFPVNRIWSTLEMLGDPYAEKEFIIKHAFQFDHFMFVSRNESWQTAYSRALSLGYIK